MALNNYGVVKYDRGKRGKSGTKLHVQSFFMVPLDCVPLVFQGYLKI